MLAPRTYLFPSTPLQAQADVTVDTYVSQIMVSNAQLLFVRVQITTSLANFVCVRLFIP